MINWDKDADGIVTLVMDDPDQGANTMNATFGRSFKETVQRLVAERDDITGVILTSAKKTFFAGGNLSDLQSITPDRAEEFFAGIENLKGPTRAPWRRSANPSSRPSTAPRSAAASRSPSRATTVWRWM